MAQEFNTPVGRIVWGHPRVAAKKRDSDNKVILKDGKEIDVWAFGLAIPKADFDQYVKPYLEAEARTTFPNGVPAGFAWKYKDGDGVDRKGKPYADRHEAYRGCYILTVSTEAFAPEVFKREASGFRSMADNEVKCGDFVSVALTVKNNGATGNNTPGIYVNPKALQFVAYGEEIVGGGADPDALFGNTNYAIPAGASATPIASTGAAAPGMATQTPPAATTTQQPPAYVNQTPAAPAAAGMPAGIPPATGFATGAPAVPTPPAPPAPPAPPVVFPPAGWVAHPQSPGWYWNQSTNEVLSEADLRTRGR